MRGQAFWSGAALLMAGFPLLAFDTPRPVGRYLVTHYGAEEGQPARIINDIVQSKDGFLWLATGFPSLVRFDGQTFYTVPTRRTHALAVTPDGDLWVDDGSQQLTRMAADRLNQFGLLPTAQYPLEAYISERHLHVGRDGVLWVGAQNGLYRLDRGVFTNVAPGLKVGRIEESADGHLHLIANGSYVEWDGARIVPHPEVAQQLGIRPEQVFHVYQDSRGVMWFCTALGVARRVGSSFEWLAFGPGKTAYRAYEDTRGVVWIAAEGGLYEATAEGLDLVDADIRVRSLFSDRDGNLWVGTNGAGLFRLRERRTRLYTPADGLPNKIIMAVMADHDGTIWSGANCGGLSRFDGHSFRTYAEKDGLLNSCVYSIAEDVAHDLWLGTYGGGAFRFHNGTFTQFSKPQGLPSDVVFTVLAASDGAVWLGTSSGVSRLVDGQIRNFTPADGQPHHITSMTEDRNGVLWAANTTGVERLAGDRFVRVPEIPELSLVLGELVPGFMYIGAGVDEPLSRVENHRLVSVVPFKSFAAIGDRKGNYWLCGDTIVRLPAREVLEPSASSEPIEYTMFGPEDGLSSSGCTSGYPKEALGKDDRLWEATLEGLAMMDLDGMVKTSRQAVTYMGELTVGREQIGPGRELVLPPGTHHVELRFNPIELVSPEKIRMQYRLDGVDTEWLDAKMPAIATYSNIPAGSHAFRMRSCNRDGVWDLKGTTYTVIQQPYFYETVLFQLSMAALFVLALGVAYHFRVRQIAASINARFDERLAERTRIARDFHDTLMQTIQGSKMVADTALENSNSPERMKYAMERLSKWLGQAIQEGRQALSSLRSSTTERNDLAEAIGRAGEECRLQRAMEFRLTLEGTGTEMHPIVRDEVYRIAYEAIRNACNHSGATALTVELSYLNDLLLRVCDNGRGFEAAAAAERAPGHYGLLGMYERAARIRGRLTISSSPAGGTQVELKVPRRVAFPAPPGRLVAFRRRWRRLLGGE